MVDWVSVSSLAAGVGTLALAAATLSSVRAANRSAQASEQALRLSNRPLLIASHIYDQPEKFRFIGSQWVKLAGGHAFAEATPKAIYLAISLRNIGQGTAVLNSWSFTSDFERGIDTGDPHSYRQQVRDIYVPAGGVGFWQGAIRDPHDAQFAEATSCIQARRDMVIRIQYTDQEGEQRTISLFSISPTTHANDWLATAGRHWRLDSQNPREF